MPPPLQGRVGGVSPHTPAPPHLEAGATTLSGRGVPSGLLGLALPALPTASLPVPLP